MNRNLDKLSGQDELSENLFMIDETKMKNEAVLNDDENGGAWGEIESNSWVTKIVK